MRSLDSTQVSKHPIEWTTPRRSPDGAAPSPVAKCNEASCPRYAGLRSCMRRRSINGPQQSFLRPGRPESGRHQANFVEIKPFWPTSAQGWPSSWPNVALSWPSATVPGHTFADSGRMFAIRRFRAASASVLPHESIGAASADGDPEDGQRMRGPEIGMAPRRSSGAAWPIRPWVVNGAQDKEKEQLHMHNKPPPAHIAGHRVSTPVWGAHPIGTFPTALEGARCVDAATHCLEPYTRQRARPPTCSAQHFANPSPCG